MQNPFCSSLAPYIVLFGTLQECRRVRGGRVCRTGPHQHPRALAGGHLTAPTPLSIPISLPLPSLSGQDGKTDREKHLRGGEKPICFGFPVAPSLGSAQAV